MPVHRIRFVVFRYNHHSPHSGYSLIAEYGATELKGEIIRVSKPLSRRIIRERMLWRLSKGTPGYDRAAMAAELKVAGQMLKDRGYIYHFLYGEKTYHYAGLLKDVRQNHLVATFHQPPTGIRDSVQIDWHLHRLSALVCVGRNQQEYFAKILDPDRVFFAPLGVDTQYYTPPSSFDQRDPNLCIFVGENYRDYPTLRGVIELVADKRPNTKFVGVTPSEALGLIGVHPNLTLLSGVPESKLLDLYRSAALMIMPLRDATANNAVLESMACGLPLVVSDVGAIRDYVDEDGSILIPMNDSRGMAEAVLELLDEPRERSGMGEKSRQRALQFDWHRAVEHLQSIYAAIA